MINKERNKQKKIFFFDLYILPEATIKCLNIGLLKIKKARHCIVATCGFYCSYKYIVLVEIIIIMYEDTICIPNQVSIAS